MVMGLKFGKFWLVVGGYGWLWVVVAGCGWFWVVVGGCGWLWVVVGGCGSCCTCELNLLLTILHLHSIFTSFVICSLPPLLLLIVRAYYLPLSILL